MMQRVSVSVEFLATDILFIINLLKGELFKRLMMKRVSFSVEILDTDTLFINLLNGNLLRG